MAGKVITVTMDNETYQRLRYVSYYHDLSISAQVRTLILDALKVFEKEHGIPQTDH